MLVFGTIGTAIGLGARELTRALPWAGLVIGAALVLAGAAVLAGGHLRLRLPQPRYRSTSGSLRADVLFGIGYGTASLSCTLPILVIATGDDAEVRVEGRGYARRERPDDSLWQVAATLRFDSDDQRDAWLNHRLAVWEGELDAKQERARYRAYITPDTGLAA